MCWFSCEGCGSSFHAETICLGLDAVIATLLHGEGRIAYKCCGCRGFFFGGATRPEGALLTLISASCAHSVAYVISGALCRPCASCSGVRHDEASGAEVACVLRCAPACVRTPRRLGCYMVQAAGVLRCSGATGSVIPPALR